MQNTKTMKIKMSTGEKIFSVINYIFLALVAVACLYPMLYVLFASSAYAPHRHSVVAAGFQRRRV